MIISPLANVKELMTSRHTTSKWLRTLLLVGVVVATMTPTTATAQRGRGSKAKAVTVRPVAIQNGKALGHFHRALSELAAGKRRRVRVYHFGDSNIAADMWTGYVRNALQERFGDGGAGYLLPPPHGSYHWGGTKVRAGPGFSTRRHGFAKLFGPRDGLWGLAGAAMEGLGAGAWFEARIPASPGGSTFELHLLGQQPSGRVAVVIDRRRPDVVDTLHPSQGLIRQIWPLGPESHIIKGQVVSSRPVRVLGMVSERNQPGVVYDTLGINGHRITAVNLWNVPLLATEFRQRPPDLIVLSYGANEGLSEDLSLDRLEGQMRKAVLTVRRLAPDASVLLVGPVAMCPVRPKVTKVADIQRRVAPEYGAGFWDTRQVSGGPGSLCHWIATDRTLVSRDRLHLRKAGYELIAREFTTALLAGYSQAPSKNDSE